MAITHTASQNLGSLLNLGARQPPAREGQGFQQVMERKMDHAAERNPSASAQRQSRAEPSPRDASPGPADARPDPASAGADESAQAATAPDDSQAGPVDVPPDGDDKAQSQGRKADPVAADDTVTDETPVANELASVQMPAIPIAVPPAQGETATSPLAPLMPLTGGAASPIATRVTSTAGLDGAAPAVLPEAVAPAPAAAGASLDLPPSANLPQPGQTAEPALVSQASNPLNAQLPVAGGAGQPVTPDASLPAELDLDGAVLKSLPEASQKSDTGVKTGNPDMTGLNGRVLQTSAALHGAPLNPQVLEISRAEARPGSDPSATVSPLAPQARPGELSGARPAPVTVPVSQPNWAQATGERVLWMVHQKVQAAEIQLDPPELGPLQVRVSVHQDQVSVSFVSAHGQVRDALDMQSLRLREMFEAQGLNLVDVDVSDQGFQRGQTGEQASGGGRLTADADQEPATVLESPLNSDQLIDQFV